MSFFTKLKWIEHVVAAAGAGVAAFTMTPAGQAIVHQYPVLAPVITVLGFLGAFYHTPKSS